MSKQKDVFVVMFNDRLAGVCYTRRFAEKLVESFKSRPMEGDTFAILEEQMIDWDLAQ
jgi:hypothetical protein